MEVRTQIDLFDEWFRIADKDRDGRVGGGEAVEFLQRSGLSKETLFQVWQVVAGDSAFLSKPQFYSAMRLVSMAQRGGGVIEEGQARQVMIGMGPPVPPPHMAGLDQLKTAVPQLQPAAAPTAAYGQRASALPPPPLNPDDAQRYIAMFAQMDNDHDGFVQGADCFGAFMQWGLPKELLKQIWAVVAGDEGQLTAQQFLSCLYLMDNAKKGIQPPAQLPPGQFPPLAPGANYAKEVLSIANIGGRSDVFSQQIQVPDLLPRARHIPAEVPEYEGQLPGLDEAVAGQLGFSERQRLSRETAEATNLDKQLHKVTNELEAAKAKEAFYQQALQQLTLFKSKTSAALLQAQEWADREVREADTMQQQYESTYTTAEVQFKDSRNLLADIQKARSRKLEHQTRLAALQKDIEQLSSLSEKDMLAEDADTKQLQQEIAELETQRAQLELQAGKSREGIEALQREVGLVEAAIDEAQPRVKALQDEEEALMKEFKAEDSESLFELQRLLLCTSDVYKSLVKAAKEGGIPIPEEAQLGAAATAGPGELGWDEYAAASAADWDDFQDEGFKVVNVLPDDKHKYLSPTSSMTSLHTPASGPSKEFNFSPDAKRAVREHAAADTSASGTEIHMADTADTADSAPVIAASEAIEEGTAESEVVEMVEADSAEPAQPAKIPRLEAAEVVDDIADSAPETPAVKAPTAAGPDIVSVEPSEVAAVVEQQAAQPAADKDDPFKEWASF